MISTVFTFLISLAKKIPWQLWLLAGVILLFWLWGNFQYSQGAKKVQGDWNAAVERGKVIVKDLKEKASQINTVVETKVVTETKVIREKGDTIVKEIPIYIPADTVDLPGGFRLLHDAAARSELPDRTRLLEAAPVRVEDATTIITENYTQCLIWRTQVLGWQEWYQEQSLAWQTAQDK